MADASDTPEDKEQKESVTTGFAEAPDAAPKLVAPDAVPEAPAAVPTAAAHSHDGHSHDSHGHDGHSHDSHDAHDTHAHDEHPAATDIIPEDSPQDKLLSCLSMCVLLAFVLLIGYWSQLPLAQVAAEHTPGAIEQH